MASNRRLAADVAGYSRLMGADEEGTHERLRAVRVYGVNFCAIRKRASPALALPDKPSIAMLPFQNITGDPDQEYFADGVVEEITTALSRAAEGGTLDE